MISRGKKTNVLEEDKFINQTQGTGSGYTPSGTSESPWANASSSTTSNTNNKQTTWFDPNRPNASNNQIQGFTPDPNRPASPSNPPGNPPAPGANTAPGANPTDTNILSSTSVGTNPATFLYDVGLQNVYQDYQRGMQALTQREQQSLQDAYYIREMSKKYLGEYASNMGVGDVSGNLLDIYGQYQQAVTGIGMETGAQELSLQQQYDQTRRQLEMGRMTAAQTAANTENAPIGFADISSQQVMDMSGNLVNNPNFNQDFDFTYYNLPEGFNRDSQSVYTNDAGVEFFNVAVDASTESDGEGEFSGGPTNEEISEFFVERNNDQIPTNGDVIAYTNGVNYVLRDGKWYRLQQMGADQGFKNIQRLMQTQQTGWSGNNISFGGRGTLGNRQGVIIESGENNNPNDDVVFVNLDSNGKLQYTNASATGGQSAPLFDAMNTTKDSDKEIIETFRRVHGTGARVGERYGYASGDFKKPSVVEHKGVLYFMNKDGKVWKLRPRNAMTN